MKRVALIILFALTACSSQVTAVPTPSQTAAVVPIPSQTLTLTLTPITATVASGDEVVSVVTSEVYGHEIQFEMKDSYLVKNENTVGAITDALLTALMQGEYADKGFGSVEDFVKWIYSDENPAGAGKLAWQRPVDDPSVVQKPGVNGNKVVWEEQPVWDLSKGIVWTTDFNATSVPKEVQPDTPSYWGEKLRCVAIVNEQNGLHVYAAQEGVAKNMQDHTDYDGVDEDAAKHRLLQDISTYCLAYFQVLAHHGEGASALIQGYEAIPFPTLRQQVKTWFNYDINWGQE